jgi:hypothetical protein
MMNEHALVKDAEFYDQYSHRFGNSIIAYDAQEAHLKVRITYCKATGAY